MRNEWGIVAAYRLWMNSAATSASDIISSSESLHDDRHLQSTRKQATSIISAERRRAVRSEQKDKQTIDETDKN